MAANTLDVLRRPHDEFRYGPRSLAAEKMPKHPVELVQKMAHKQKWDSQVATAAQIYGSHAALRMQMDRAILAGVRRAPGLHSNFSGLDTLLGRDEDIGFEDFLGDPKDNPEKPGAGMQELLRADLFR